MGLSLVNILKNIKGYLSTLVPKYLRLHANAIGIIIISNILKIMNYEIGFKPVIFN